MRVKVTADENRRLIGEKFEPQRDSVTFPRSFR